MSVRIALLSEDDLFCEGLARIIAAEPSFVVVRKDDVTDVLLLDAAHFRCAPR